MQQNKAGYLCPSICFKVYSLLKPLLFSLDAEKAHHLTFDLLSFGATIPGFLPLLRHSFHYENASLQSTHFGLTFRNPVGLAAGLDKNAQYLHELHALGFGFIEVGTLTPRPQPGNPKPRLFRLPKDEALINRMGFNNEGVDAAIPRLAKKPEGLIVGGNIGKNKSTPNKEATRDYEICFQKLFPYVDYFVVNVSSPNTPGLRDLQDREPLTRLLSHLQHINRGLATPKPLLLKIAPDLNTAQLDDIIAITHTTQLDGLIATNTTIARTPLTTAASRLETVGAGGMSGAPLLDASNKVLHYLRQALGPELPIIGVGGVHDAASARSKFAAGANLIQVYSGLVYQGPGLVKQIKKGLATG